MKIPYQLRRRTTTEPAWAFLVETADAQVVLDLCARLGGDGLHRIHAVANGFLVRLEAPTERVFPGALRLRRRAEHFYLPVDAELSPALLDDEAEGLTRRRGLVFLPDGRVLAFDPSQPLPLSSLILAEQIKASNWKPLPSRPPRARRIVEILRDLSDEGDLDSILEAGGQDIGTEEPGPDPTGKPSRVVGGAAMSAGQGMMWMGRKLGLSSLSRAGARLVQSALEIAPRMSEALLGRHEGALRDLLRQFREGNVEDALRRALPLGGEASRGAQIDSGSNLPRNDLHYSLQGLLGGGGGTTSYWFGDFDVQQELAREYRKAAASALQNGDFRRAAFIHGRLLHDYRTAANVLLQGGLARDAARIYLEKLNDPLAAAQAFESAGDVDRALQLFRQAKEFERAGDLLQRLGEPADALADYRRAADSCLNRGGGHLRAGDLMLRKAQRPDLAFEYFAAGWQLRPCPNDVACAIRMAQIYCEHDQHAELLRLVCTAEAHFAPNQDESNAALFFNELARLAEALPDNKLREELRDRALMALAHKLKQRSALDHRAGTLVSTLLDSPHRWPIPLTRDAEFAVDAQIRRRIGSNATSTYPLLRHESSRLKIGSTSTGTVSAVAFAPESEEIVLGFRNGDIYRVSPQTGEVFALADYPAPVAALAVDRGGKTVVALWMGENLRKVIAAYQRQPDGTFRMTEGRSETGGERPWLTPVVHDQNGSIVGYWNGEEYATLSGSALIPSMGFEPAIVVEDLQIGLLLPSSQWPEEPLGLYFGGNGHWILTAKGDFLGGWHTGWTPCLPQGSSLALPPLSYLRPASSRLEIVGIGTGATLYRTVLQLQGDNLEFVTTNISAVDEIYLAATLLRPGFVAGVTPRAIHWLRGVSTRFTRLSTTDIAIPKAVACYPCHHTRELIVIRSDGWIERVPMPNH